MKPLKPANKGTDDSYDPQGSGMSHDPLFAELCPGVANSGNLAHKWSVGNEHNDTDAPPTGMKGE